MGIVHKRPGWWIEPDGRGLSGDAPSLPRVTPDEGRTAEVRVQIRPLGQRSQFMTRPMAYACLNCHGWIHPGNRAWYDPDLDESLCASCWPEWVSTVRPG